MDQPRNDISLAILIGPPPEDLSLWPGLGLEAQRAIFAATAASLLDSLRAARSLGCTHAISFVTGAVASTDEFSVLVDAARQNPSSVILGIRSGAVPSAFFHRLAELFFRLETGLRLGDINGPRVYPLRLLDTIAISRTTTHTELLVRAAWAACPIVEISLPLPALSHVDGSTKSSRRRSSVSELRTHLRLLARALGGWPHARYDADLAHLPLRRSLLPRLAGKCVRLGQRIKQPSFWRRVLQWFNPLRAWRELRQGGATRSEIAAGLAAGVFIANTPAWGFHTVLALYVARRLHLHPLAVVAGSNSSAPPMGPFLVAAAMWLGHIITHGSIPVWSEVTPFHGNFVAHALPLLLDWLIGAAVIGTALAITVFIIANFLFRFLERKELDNSHPMKKPTGAQP